MKYYNRVGEPFGTLVLALAVTVIEVALIVSVMVAGKTGLRNPSSAAFVAVMLILNGFVGLSIDWRRTSPRARVGVGR
jgi:Ca2+:H+ antiporter